MAKRLDVYLFRDLVGHLIQDDGGQMAFDYTGSWIEKTRRISSFPISAFTEKTILAQRVPGLLRGHFA